MAIGWGNYITVASILQYRNMSRPNRSVVQPTTKLNWLNSGYLYSPLYLTATANTYAANGTLIPEPVMPGSYVDCCA